MRDIASLLRIWPPIWNAVRGRVAARISLLGFRTPSFRMGSLSRIVRLCLASQERNKHQNETRANCTIVKVTGRGKAVRMTLEEVLVRSDVVYQTQHRSCEYHQL